MTSAPIIIIGSPRSGTTILGNLLARHPELHYEEEPRLTWRYGNDNKSDCLTINDLNESKKKLIRNAFENRVQRSGKKRLLEKTPSNALRPEFVDAVFPDSKMIHISRDPIECILSIRDMWLRNAHGIKNIDKSNYLRRLREIRPSQVPYYSMEFIRRCLPLWLRSKNIKNLWGPRFPGMQEMLREMGVLSVCCLQWRFCTEACNYFRQVYPDRMYHLQLEDITENSLINLLQYCDLQNLEMIVETFRSEFSQTLISKRRDAATKEDLETIKRWIGPHFN